MIKSDWCSLMINGFKGEGLKLKDKFTEADSQLGNHEKVERPRCAKNRFKALSHPVRTQECMNITQHKKVQKSHGISKALEVSLANQILPRISEGKQKSNNGPILDF